MLKSYHKDAEDPDRRKSSRAPVGIRMEFDKETEEIIADRIVRQANNHPRLEYFVKWKGLPVSESSWEPATSSLAVRGLDREVPSGENSAMRASLG